jgi:hypothetical protein
MKIEKDDWVRFYKDGELVIWKVEYITKDISGDILNTHEGTVNATEVLEVRRQKEN